VRVVVTGATGNVGTAVLRALAADEKVDSIVGVARRIPDAPRGGVSWHSADVASSPLEPVFDGADAVIHLAWAIQPSRDEDALEAINVDGSRRVFDAAAEVGIETVVYASSVGAYSPGPKNYLVDESWPVNGIESLFYSRHKVEVEAELDRFQRRRPGVRVVRMRPGLIFGREAATGIRRLFLGPLLPRWIAERGRIPVVPDVERLRFQAVHRDDVAEAYRLALHRPTDGAVNVAAEPILDPEVLANLLEARRIRLPGAALRVAADVSWRLRLQPTPAGWVDLALAVPLMSTQRAHVELGWRARRTSGEALLDLLDGIRTGAGHPTPPLDPATSGTARWREFASGVGGRTSG
jgi:nucleoside-diphosphate-sugar epimerase